MVDEWIPTNKDMILHISFVSAHGLFWIQKLNETEKP